MCRAAKGSLCTELSTIIADAPGMSKVAAGTDATLDLLTLSSSHFDGPERSYKSRFGDRVYLHNGGESWAAVPFVAILESFKWLLYHFRLEARTPKRSIQTKLARQFSP